MLATTNVPIFVVLGDLAADGEGTRSLRGRALLTGTNAVKVGGPWLVLGDVPRPDNGLILQSLAQLSGGTLNSKDPLTARLGQLVGACLPASLTRTNVTRSVYTVGLASKTVAVRMRCQPLDPKASADGVG